MPGITDPTEAYFKDGQWGWDGTQWRKLPLVWGFSGQLFENLGGTKDGNGSYTALSTAVPAGEIHVVTLISLVNHTGARGLMKILVTTPAYYVSLGYELTPAVDDPVIFSGHLYLATGDLVTLTQLSCINGDVLQGAICGYKMAIAE